MAKNKDFFYLAMLRTAWTHKPKNPIFHTPSKTHHHLHHPLFSTPPNSPAPLPDHQSEQFKAAQDALLEFLQECGVSETEAAFVSSNSPRYLKMLVDGVLELDELGLWRERERKEGRELVGFKEKVRYLDLDNAWLLMYQEPLILNNDVAF